MSRPNLLSEEEINEYLIEVPLWNLENNSIVRDIVASNFTAAIGIVNSIAIEAEVIDHHPDILIYGWNKIKITLSTHDRGGLTELDFKLAKKIDNLKF